MFKNILKKTLVFLLSLALLLAAAPAGPGRAEAGTPPFLTMSCDPEGVRLVVETDPGADLEALEEYSGGKLVRTGPFNYLTLEFIIPAVSAGGEGSSAESEKQKKELLEKVLKFPGVLGAEWSRTYTVDRAGLPGDSDGTGKYSVMSDPEYSLQWYLKQIRADLAWAEGTTGRGVTVAVVDTGVDLTHPEFYDEITGESSFVDGYDAYTRSTGPQAGQDDHGHGTSMAGVIAARKNGKGIVGIAYDAKIMPVKAMDKDGEGEDSILADGIVWAVDNGAGIINLSIGAASQSKILDDALKYAADKGCIITGASGNKKGVLDPESSGTDALTGDQVAYPGADPNVIAVSAVDKNDRITDFSLTGPEVLLSAPGSKVLTTYWKPEETGLAYTTGTSIAAPFVAAAAALLWSAHPGLTSEEITQALFSSANDLGIPGRDDQYGFGRLDVYRALKYLQEPELFPSPALLGWEGGRVYASGLPGSGTEKPPAELAVLPGTFTLKAGPDGVEQKLSLSINSTDSPGDFPEGIIAAGEAWNINPWGEDPVSRPLILRLELENPPLKQTGEEYISYLYKWSGSRWIRAGGGYPAGGILEAAVYEPGIYRAGWTPAPQEDRIAGADRIATALEIAREAFPTGADTVILARADDFPDALAGAPLAYKYRAPILLTFPDRLGPETRQTIADLAPRHIIVLGGPEAVSFAVEEELSAIAHISRIAGDNRYATAAAVAETLGTKGRAVLVNGTNFPDAIAAASHAACQGRPILLTPADYLAGETEAVLKKLSVTDTQVAGGPAAITALVYEKLFGPVRLSGTDRYATSAEVIRLNPPGGKIIYTATGLNFPDALTGGVLAAVGSSNILLIPPPGPTPAQEAVLKGLKGKKAVALGGEGAVSAEALGKVQELVE